MNNGQNEFKQKAPSTISVEYWNELWQRACKKLNVDEEELRGLSSDEQIRINKWIDSEARYIGFSSTLDKLKGEYLETPSKM